MHSPQYPNFPPLQPYPAPSDSSLQTILKIVLNSLPSPHSKDSYNRAIRDFLKYWRSEGKPLPDKLFLQSYIIQLQESGKGASAINVRIAAIRKFANEAADSKVWPDEVAASFARVSGIPDRGERSGHWLSLEQAQQLINAPDANTIVGLRDRALLAVMLGCGLRRMEVSRLSLNHIQRRENIWLIVDIVGKRNKKRTIVMPDWTYQSIAEYLKVVGITQGYVFRAISKSGKILKPQLSTKSIFDAVKKYTAACGFPEVAPHDLRRTYAKLAYKYGAKIDQIQLNLGHQSLDTTQRYLGTDLNIYDGPGSYLKINL